MYNVVFKYTEYSDGNEGVITWNSFKDEKDWRQSELCKMCKRPDAWEVVIAEGVTYDEAIELTKKSDYTLHTLSQLRKICGGLCESVKETQEALKKMEKDNTTEITEVSNGKWAVGYDEKEGAITISTFRHPNIMQLELYDVATQDLLDLANMFLSEYKKRHQIDNAKTS